MNRVIKIYTELDSLYDTRRGTIELLLLDHESKEKEIPEENRKLLANQLWNRYIADNYKERLLDTFEYKNFGINRETFVNRYNKRSISDWTHYYPTNLTDRLIKLVMDLELMEEKPIDISGITLVVNTFPFVFDEELNRGLIGHLTTALNNIVNVKLMSFDTRNQTLDFYKNYDYVFKYDILTSENTKAFQESIGSNIRVPELRIMVPDILVKTNDAFTGNVSDMIEVLTVTLAPTVTIVPVKHEVYDCIG